MRRYSTGEWAPSEMARRNSTRDQITAQGGKVSTESETISHSGGTTGAFVKDYQRIVTIQADPAFFVSIQ